MPDSPELEEEELSDSDVLRIWLAASLSVAEKSKEEMRVLGGVPNSEYSVWSAWTSSSTVEASTSSVINQAGRLETCRNLEGPTWAPLSLEVGR